MRTAASLSTLALCLGCGEGDGSGGGGTGSGSGTQSTSVTATSSTGTASSSSTGSHPTPAECLAITSASECVQTGCVSWPAIYVPNANWVCEAATDVHVCAWWDMGIQGQNPTVYRRDVADGSFFIVTGLIPNGIEGFTLCQSNSMEPCDCVQ